MADANSALSSALADWSARRAAQEAAFRAIEVGKDGYFQRAVNAVCLMLEAALAATVVVKPKGDGVGRDFLEVFPTIMRSEDSELTIKRVEQLIADSETDSYSFQQLEYMALNPTFLLHFPALSAWQKNVYLGAAKRPVRRGPHINANYYRNAAICSAIEKLHALNIDPYRGDASPGISGCDIVSEALGKSGQNLSYSGVEKVWEKRAELAFGAGGNDLAQQLADKILALLSETNRT